LLLPFLVIMVLGVIELGRFAYTGILVTSAARAGAAYASQGISQSTDNGGIQAAADSDYTNNGGDAGTLAVSSSPTCGCDSGGSFTSEVCRGTGAGTCSPGHWVISVSVTASGTYTPLFNYPGIMTSSVPITRTATMRVAQYGG
jgi:Flp pilus assembly protein TadG